MKKLVSLLLTAGLAVGCLAGCGSSEATDDTKTNTEASASSDATTSDSSSDYKVAMVTDYGDITDQSFNQTTYEACQAFCNENNIEFNYYKPTDDSTAARVASVEQAVDEGYNVLVMPGYAFAGTIVETCEEYEDVKFIALDCSLGDILSAAVGEDYDYNPDNWDVADYVDLSNVYCAIYQEEISGYLAGYAAVKLGYKDLGFLGGMAVPAVIRYGYGFVQGCDAAATELGEKINIKYAYGNQFSGDADITAAMDTWYNDGTEVVFSCGGGIFTSAAEAAAKVDGKVIGVDVDQAGTIDGKYGEGMTVTSAMKGLAPTVKTALTDIILNDSWSDYAGKILTLGMVSGDDPEANYVQIPMDTTQWSDSFSQDDYKAIVASIYAGDVKISNDISAMPATTSTTVTDLGNLK